MSAVPALPIAIEIDQDTRDRVDRLALAKQRTPHGLMQEAISQYVDREEKRDAFRRDAIEAWNDYRGTGLHATAAEVDAWLAKLETGEDAPPPECHV